MINKKLKILICCVAITAMINTTPYSVFAATTASSNSAVTASSKSVSSNFKLVDANSTWVVDTTTKLSKLTIGDGSTITAPDGYSVTLSVNGVGKTIEPGTYEGDVVLSITKQNVVEYSNANLTHYFRQGLYVDSTGVVDAKSVKAVVVGGKVTTDSAVNVKINSDEESFNGIYVAGGTYNVKGTKIDFTGNGGNDFAGFGAGIMATGSDTTLVVDSADVQTHGAIRPAIIAANGSNLVVKNSNIKTENGILPADYKPNVQLGLMKSAPWMLGISGNCRATNVLGSGTTSTYINSSVASEGWGVLSTDDCSNVKLTSINSNISITGNSGYGAYAIGDAVDTFYGSKINTPDYSMIITGGTGIFGASTSENVQTANNSLKLGLTSNEMKALKETQTTVKSDRFGVMCHGSGNIYVKDGTTFDTGETTFLIKGTNANINVDGSKGAQLKTGNGVLLQLMDNDDPGPVMTDGVMYNTGVYHEPTGDATLDTAHNTTTVTSGTDTIANFSNITLNGNFYNSTRGGTSTDMTGKEVNLAKNLSLNFDNTKITGVISSSNAKHAIYTITSDEYKQLGEVTNAPAAAINNGAIVSLTNGSTWTVTGNSYLTSLTIADGAKITAPDGYKVTMKVNGSETNISSGTYKGEIELIVTKNNN
jgi:hypothetical protein